MLTPTPIIKHTRSLVPETNLDLELLEDTSAADTPPFLGGIIRDEVARLHAQPVAIDSADWSSESLPSLPETNHTLLSPQDRDDLRTAWEAIWKQQSDTEREAAVAAAREDAYAEGMAAAQAERDAEWQMERTAFADDAARLRSLWEDHLAVIDPLLVELAVDVAEAVLDRPLDDKAHEATTAAVTAAVERLAAHPPLVITLHPVDHLRLQEAGMVDALTASHPGLRWAPDTTLAEGDWSLDATGAAIRHVRAEILSDLRRRLGLEVGPTPNDVDTA